MLFGNETVGRIGSSRSPCPPIMGSTDSTWAGTETTAKKTAATANGKRVFFIQLWILRDSLAGSPYRRCQCELATHFNLLGRAANEHIEIAGLRAPLFCLDVIIRERAAVEYDRYLPRLSRTKAHFQKPFQLLRRPRNFRLRVANIYLGHVGTLAYPSVLYFERNLIART